MSNQAVDMWTMRWRAPTPTVDNAQALPTAGVFDHITTAFDHHKSDQLKKEHPALIGADRAWVGQFYFGEFVERWVRFTSALTTSTGQPVEKPAARSLPLTRQIPDARRARPEGSLPSA